MPKEMTWRKAIEKILSEASGAMHYKDLTDKIIEDGLRVSLGATPTRTVNAHLTTAIKNERDNCPFQKAGKGLFIWKDSGANTTHGITPEEIDEEDEVQHPVITSFGMFWRRDAVDWTSNPKLLGMEQIGADAVDFSNQIGIYLLYDGREVIYVGRTTDRPLGKRLYEHTMKRLSTRWDRFSWFGMLPVSETGELGEFPRTFPAEKLIPAMEAILIEAMEPCQNRKRGDGLPVAEYFQKENSEIQKKKARQMFEAVLNNKL
ncbi:MAG: HTH domain-containing protein [Geobacteraceae bacterium]